MAFRNRLPCYVCDRLFRPGLLAGIDGNENPDKRDMAIHRRDGLGRPPLIITLLTRLYINCNQSMRIEIAKIERDPSCLRLNVLTKTANRSCVVCNAIADIHRLSLESRANVFILLNIYVPEDVKSCRIQQQLQVFLQEIRNIAVKRLIYEDENSFTDSEFEAFSPVTKEQFRELFTYCDPIPRQNGFRYVMKKDLLMFLCKLIQALSDEFLKVMFQNSSRQATSLVITAVRRSLMIRFVPESIGFGAITRAEYIERYVTEFANILYNPDPEIVRVVVTIDGTYSYIEKIIYFRFLRQSYCVHKGRHLVKPALLVAPNGYILDIQRPYLSDSRNNDAAMLLNEFKRDIEGMRAWFQKGDIVVFDLGYRDARPLLENLGIRWKMPSLLERGQRQLTTEQASELRLVTKTRWIMEARNGHIKSIFKFFAQVIRTHHLHHLGDFY